MIHSITLRNFQSHKNNTIVFDEGVNAIVGLTDSGKTAILRGFFWVIYNRPVGDDFMSHWAKIMSVMIGMSDGTQITRGRDKKGNYYKLDNQEFRAFKSEVPPEIQQALNLSDVNLQSQMDAPFLLHCGPGEVAQILNRIVHLDVIDRAISNIRKKKLDVDKELRYTDTRIEALKSSIENYSYLDDMEVDVTVYEQLSRSYIATSSKLSSLSRLVKDIKEAQDRMEKYDEILRAESALKVAMATKNKLSAVEDKADKLGWLIREIKQKEVEMIEYGEQAILKKAKFDKMMPSRCPLCGR